MSKAQAVKAAVAPVAQSNVVLIVGNIFFVVIELLALLVQNPLPIITPAALPYLVFLQAALNIIARQFLQPVVAAETPDLIVAKVQMTEAQQATFLKEWDELVKHA